jgi:hypothetical protein
LKKLSARDLVDAELRRLSPAEFVCACGDHAWRRINGPRVILIDAADVELLRLCWHATSTKRKHSYARVNLGGRSCYLHHVIAGDASRDVHIDHINRNPLDNRRSNLRRVSRAQNRANGGPRSDKLTSKFKGVAWRRRDRRWIASISVNGRTKHIKSFRDEKAAALAYDAAAKELWGEFAYLNFPLGTSTAGIDGRADGQHSAAPSTPLDRNQPSDRRFASAQNVFAG